MTVLRNILQKCARKASILSGTTSQIQCTSTFNPVYMAPTCILRQAYSSDANEAPKNAKDSVQKYILEMMNSKKSLLQDQNASNTPTVNQNLILQNSPLGQTTKSQPGVAEDQNALKTPTFNKNLNLRKYYINVRHLSKETTPESLREFYSQFGEIASCNIIFQGDRNQFGSIAFLNEEAMNRALNSLPHCIDGKETKNVRSAVLARRQLTLCVLDLSPKTTRKSLEAYYSRFGILNDLGLKQGADAEIGQVGEVTFAYQKDLHRALDAQPHVIDGSEVFLQYATYDLDLWIQEIPEAITEEDLNSFYSKYGQLRRCRLFKGKTGKRYSYVSYSALGEVNSAMEDRPHIIAGKPLKIGFVARGHKKPASLFVGSIPENVTEETLRKEFSKFGKPVFWKLENDGRFNQSGPYGIVLYGTDEEALKALNSGPHMIEGSVVDVRIAKEAIKSLSKKY